MTGPELYKGSAFGILRLSERKREKKLITKSDKDAVNEARAAYRGLTKAQKKYVTKAAYNKLKADMNAFKKLK